MDSDAAGKNSEYIIEVEGAGALTRSAAQRNRNVFCDKQHLVAPKKQAAWLWP